MNAYWAVHTANDFGHFEAAVFAYLAKTCNALFDGGTRGKNPFDLRSSVVLRELGMHPNEFSRALKKLTGEGCVEVVRKGTKRQAACYRILCGVSYPVTNAGGENEKTGQVSGQNVRKPVTPSRGKKEENLERGAGRLPLSKFELIDAVWQRAPKWRRLRNIGPVIDKMYAEYAAKPHRITVDKALDWLEAERGKTFFGDADLVPREPDGFRAKLEFLYPGSPLCSHDWDYLWRNRSDIIREVGFDLERLRDERRDELCDELRERFREESKGENDD